MHVSQYSLWNVLTFGAVKFQVDVKVVKGGGGGGEGGLTKRPADVKRGKSEYVDGP